MKRLLLTLLLTFGLSLSASGQDWKTKARLMNANQEYALDLWRGICLANYRNHLDLASKTSLFSMEINRSVALAKECRGSVLSLCTDAMNDYVNDSFPTIDQFIASLKTSPPQCLSIDSFIDQRMIELESFNTELESILLSND